MQPDFDLRIRSMIKALTETVMPGLDPDNRTAIEQLNIVIGSLALFKEQVDFVHWFEAVETEEMMELATLLSDRLGPAVNSILEDAKDAAIRAVESRAALSDRRKGNVDLRNALVQLIDRGLKGGTSIGIRETVLTFSARQIGRERAFIAGTGLDVFTDNLQSMRDSLQTSPASSH